MYFPCRGSHLTIWLWGSKQALLISATDIFSWYAWKYSVFISFSKTVFLTYFVIGDNWSISGQGIVNTRIRHQISLKLVEVHVQSSIKSQWSGDWWDDLSNQSIQIGISGSRNIAEIIKENGSKRPKIRETFTLQFGPANIIDGLIVYQKSAITVLQCGVRV